MADEPTHKDRLRRTPPCAGVGSYLQVKEADPESAEASCKAFGYLRGIRDQAAAVEFRFLNGNSTWFPYSWLGVWQYDPSEGLLLKFSGDLVYLVLIRGSNLDRPLKEGAVNLMQAGLQRYRVLWIREMSVEEIEQVGDIDPTIDSIEIAQFESHDDLNEWIAARALDLRRIEQPDRKHRVLIKNSAIVYLANPTLYLVAATSSRFIK